MNRVVMVWVLAVGLNFHLYADDLTGWLSFGPGIGVGSSLGPSFGGRLSFQYGKHLVSIRSVGAFFDLGRRGKQEYSSWYPVQLETTNDLAWVTEIGLLYGSLVKKDDKSSVYLSAGVGLVRGVRPGRYLYSKELFWEDEDVYEKVSFKTLGFPIEAQIFRNLSTNLGYGVGAFVCLNARLPFGGALLLLQLRE